jgi:phage terminase large subunit-like protein
MLMAANQVGKTRTGTTIDAFHALGDYPDDWEGHKFDHAPMIWCLGFSGEKTRDLLQEPLFGRLQDGKWTGGLIPASRIIDWKAMTGTSGAMREVRVKHKSGISTIKFWSYSQGQHALMGDVIDWYHVDEEPKDNSIVPQIMTRTANGDKGMGGRGILTFTPENGRTELVVKFMDNPSEYEYIQRATWDDAPHIDEDTKEALLAMYPDWQRDMRTKGLPLLGAGLIYDIGDSQIKCEPFPLPSHFTVINGMDFGWEHPQAHVQLWWNKDDDTFYVAHAWKKSKALPEVAWGAVREWAEYVPTSWPMDGLQTEKGSGRQQKSYYEEAGWDMLQTHAQWPDKGVGVEAGIVEIYRLMELGKFKVFSHLSDWFEEKMNYHRDENGKIVKTGDDLLDATRYAYMMRRHGILGYEIGDNIDDYYEDHYETNTVTGY